LLSFIKDTKKKEDQMITTTTIKQAVAKLLDKRKHKPKTHVNRISALDDPCTRRLVYHRIAADKQSSIEPTLQGIFETGTILEPVIKRIIGQLGEASDIPFRITHDNLSTSDVDTFLQRHQVEGSIDGIFEIEVAGEWQAHSVADVKTCSPYVFDSIDTFEDLQRFEWTKKYVGQLMLYALACNMPNCTIIFVNKTNLYDIKLIEFPIDMAYLDGLLEKADEINDSVELARHYEKKGGSIEDMEETLDFILPPRIKDIAICRRCRFLAHCKPNLESTGNLEISDNQEVIDMLARRQALQSAKKEFDEIDKHLKAKLITGQDLIAGDYTLTWKEVKKKEFTVKAQTSWRMNVVDNLE
tara:strand:- start:3146 stop:4213 length:1068 start_codon:yes stop_codon:yes gene_type:complete